MAEQFFLSSSISSFAQPIRTVDPPRGVNMTKRFPNGETTNRIRPWRLAGGVLLALLTALLPSSSHAQEVPLPLVRASAGERPAVPIGEKDKAGARRVSVVTLGTTKERVDSYLGAPRSGWTILCLCRSMYDYPDGTQVIFVDGRAVSASPNGLAEGSPKRGYVVEHDGRHIFFEPMVLRGVLMDGPMGAVKRQVEECFFFAPPIPIIAVPPPLPWLNPARGQPCNSTR
jgi:hypothetical protein